MTVGWDWILMTYSIVVWIADDSGSAGALKLLWYPHHHMSQEFSKAQKRTWCGCGCFMSMCEGVDNRYSVPPEKRDEKIEQEETVHGCLVLVLSFWNRQQREICHLHSYWGDQCSHAHWTDLWGCLFDNCMRNRKKKNSGQSDLSLQSFIYSHEEESAKGGKLWPCQPLGRSMRTNATWREMQC